VCTSNPRLDQKMYIDNTLSSCTSLLQLYRQAVFFAAFLVVLLLLKYALDQSSLREFLQLMEILILRRVNGTTQLLLICVNQGIVYLQIPLKLDLAN
jgi:hypothetical protein